MNDRHPAGYAPEYSGYGYEGHSDASYAPTGAAHGNDDPLFGSCQGYPAYDTGSYATVSYDTTAGSTAGTTATGHWPSGQTADYGDHTGTVTGTWYLDPSQPQPTAAYDYTQYEHTAVHAAYGEPEAAHGHAPEPAAYEQQERYGTAAYAPEHHEAEPYEDETYEPGSYDDAYDGTEDAAEPEPEHDSAEDAPAAVLPRPRGGSGGGNRRRRPARRSALLTVAVPSVAVMGVACAAAVTVNTEDAADNSRTQADGAPDAVDAPTTKLDQQLAGVNRDVDDFTDRASRSQERIDLKERQAQERAKKAAQAALKEQLRPKFMLPVKYHGLSAYFGQAGVNWMSVHTGIDFPVDYGTPVMAATDGVVRTQWNSAYGNMAIVTAPDGTETWYCHLSSTKIRSGSVKAGDVIAYSGNSGNSTGPHLHFEVRPAGGSAVDPLQWLLNHGVDPR
ncbi:MULTISPECIES: M23 family metallopeptidase [unclassified Streptomyces]|uniref:M23 family metallopeptidase n=1 Tax=unclassified Streptomyces TaxID=2593676 RepID=UPI00036BC615|nr:M23 family metallopeptidase [Streptomyces sp. BoleA5]MYX35223.1 peptidoglycan DD-metalloendopeptidase family protein [Streptomyces sp. SID8377]